MKKIMCCLLLVINISFAQGSKDVSKETLLEDMRNMLGAMSEIQKAGLYNDIPQMHKSIKTLKSTLINLTTDNVKKLLPSDEKKLYKFAKKRASMIKLYADDMDQSIKESKMSDALEDYTQILKQCSSCHMRLREW